MARSLHQVLAEIRGGEFATEVDEALREVVLAAQDSRKKASITITLELKPTGANSYSIIETLRTKLPERERLPTIFFSNEEGDLSRDNPRQERLPFREVKDQQQAKEASNVGVG